MAERNIKLFQPRSIAQIGVLSAIATILMLFEFPLWFAPNFYKMDLSELPVLIGGFAMGPLAGVMIELIKILLNFVINGTTTGGVGELANFILGCAIVLPAAILYQRHKCKKYACFGLGIGILCLVLFGCAINYFALLPFYATVFHMPLQALVQMGTAVNPAIHDLWSFILLAVAPFNLVKGILVSAVTILLYKRVSPILHRN